MNEDNILENSNLNGAEELPNPVDQEDALDKKKQEREKLGSVNLKADEETSKYEEEGGHWENFTKSQDVRN